MIEVQPSPNEFIVEEVVAMCIRDAKEITKRHVHINRFLNPPTELGPGLCSGSVLKEE